MLECFTLEKGSMAPAERGKASILVFSSPDSDAIGRG